MEMTPFLPPYDTIEPLRDAFAVKLAWLYNEWDARNLPKIREIVCKAFPKREILQADPESVRVQLFDLVTKTFHDIRGRFPAIWPNVCDKGQWIKLCTQKLALDLVTATVAVPWPNDANFPVNTLYNLVLWFDPNNHCKFPGKSAPFKLLEGNHRVCAWLKQGTPSVMPATLFIGQ